MLWNCYWFSPNFFSARIFLLTGWIFFRLQSALSEVFCINNSPLRNLKYVHSNYFANGREIKWKTIILSMEVLLLGFKTTLNYRKFCGVQLFLSSFVITFGYIFIDLWKSEVLNCLVNFTSLPKCQRTHIKISKKCT